MSTLSTPAVAAAFWELVAPLLPTCQSNHHHDGSLGCSSSPAEFVVVVTCPNGCARGQLLACRGWVQHRAGLEWHCSRCRRTWPTAQSDVVIPLAPVVDR